MVFSSPLFLFLFLPAVLAVYQLTPRPLKNLFLLLSSLVFYAWAEPAFVLLMLASIAVNYLIGLWLSSATADRRNIVAVAVLASAWTTAGSSVTATRRAPGTRSVPGATPAAASTRRRS